MSAERVKYKGHVYVKAEEPDQATKENIARLLGQAAGLLEEATKLARTNNLMPLARTIDHLANDVELCQIKVTK